MAMPQTPPKTAPDAHPAIAAAAPPRVSIIVVSYNTRAMTIACLESVIRETSTPHELIVIDNASSDGSAEAIAAAFPDVILMAERDNHGFAKANNIAAEHATGDYVLLLNPDTVILDGAIDKLIAFAETHPEAKIWGGRTLYGDMSLNRTCCFQRMSLWTVFCRATGIAALCRNHPLVSESYGNWNMNFERPVDIVTGCFILMPRALWQALGGFNLTYFMYGEEADLCLRAEKLHNARPRFTPKAEIIHYGGASERVRADKVVKLFAAKITLLRHHLSGWRQAAAIALFKFIPLQRFFLLRLLACVLPFPRLREAADSWREIWARRDEWRSGYPDL